MDRARGRAQWTGNVEVHNGQCTYKSTQDKDVKGQVEGHMGQGLWKGTWGRACGRGTWDRARERAGYYDRIRVASALGIPAKSGSGEKGCKTHIQYIYGHFREKGQVKCTD